MLKILVCCLVSASVMEALVVVVVAQLHIAMPYFSVLLMLKYDNLAGHLTMWIVILVSCLVSALGIVALVVVVVVVDTYQLTQSLESHRRDNRSHYSSERGREAAELSEQVSTPANWCTPSPNCEKQLLRPFGGFA